jgi:hypothetical protein
MFPFFDQYHLHNMHHIVLCVLRSPASRTRNPCARSAAIAIRSDTRSNMEECYKNPSFVLDFDYYASSEDDPLHESTQSAPT